MAAFTAIFAAGMGIYGAVSASKKASRARNQARTAESRLKYLENSRQPIINPYEGVKDLSSMVTDLSGMVSNPFASLGVATQAAEIQVEEADIALANALDTLRATGASAGGATALAQAALKSKKSVSASIEKQEAQNERLRATGEQKMEELKLQEARRTQSAKFGEAGRLQQADVSGRAFMFQQKEGRQMQQLDRTQAQLTGYQQQAQAASQQSNAILASTVTALGSRIGAVDKEKYTGDVTDPTITEAEIITKTGNIETTLPLTETEKKDNMLTQDMDDDFLASYYR
jgi:hypothetical protein